MLINMILFSKKRSIGYWRNYFLVCSEMGSEINEGIAKMRKAKGKSSFKRFTTFQNKIFKFRNNKF